MNGVRSTFMRRGYLLTALAALLLLAASAGTASAQSVGFSQTTGTVIEGVEANDAQGRQFRVKITRSPRPQQGDDNVGTVSIVTTPEDATTAGWAITHPTNGSNDSIAFDINNESTLVITQTEDNTNWKSEKLTIALRAAGANTSIGAPLVVQSQDNEVQPSAMFTRNSIRLTENSSTTLAVKVGVGTGQLAPTEALNLLSGDANTIQMSVTPATAFLLAAQGGVATLTIAGSPAAPVANMPGIYNVGDIATAAGADGIALGIMAHDDMSGFQNPEITLAFVAKSLMGRAAGDITAGASAMIRIESDEEIPTLSFSPTDVTINEGESVETVLIAEGAHGSEVMKVKLMVEGDADVSLMQGDKMLEEMDGHVYVDLGTSNSARLTAMSHESRELADGDMAYKAWKLVEGGTDGATIGEGSWFKVDVVGSTAVPALPLIGQLLLALFLMAGGSRLYRRRQD